MAKNFYNIDEVTAKLGMNADQIKGLVRDAKLREFRDGPKVHYKITEVDKLAASLGAAESTNAASASGGSGELVLEPLDESPAAGSGSGTGIPMGAGDASGSGTGLLSLDDSDTAADEVKLEDSSLPEPGKDDTVITADGVSVFDEEDLEVEADPMAKTVLTASASDQVALEGIGSGSGLLDLTREADDTSLGAVLEDIRADDDVPATAGEGEAAGAEAEFAPPGAVVVGPAMIIHDPTAPVYTGLMALGVLVLTLCGAVSASFIKGVWPSYLNVIYTNFMATFGGLIVLAMAVAGVGYLVGKPKGAAKPKAKKAKPVKEKKKKVKKEKKAKK